MEKYVWIARDKDGTLAMFKNKPILDYDKAWYCENPDDDFSIVNKNMFPELTFENSPQKLILKQN